MVLLDMDMPESCSVCEFIYDYQPNVHTCTLVARNRIDTNNRPHWCPLKPLCDDMQCKCFTKENGVTE